MGKALMPRKVLDHGEVQLIRSAANDLLVVNAARVSLHAQSEWEITGDPEGNGVRRLSGRDAGLISYLMRNRHGTPFEHGYFQFRVKAPIFIFREWHRHRVGHSYNEWSARYSTLEPEFYIPDIEEVLTQVGKPGAYEFSKAEREAAHTFRLALLTSCNSAYDLYTRAIESGIARQQARLVLPVNTYSEMIWSCNPRSLMHFLGLRNSEHAQMEIRRYAQEIEDIFSCVMPVTHAAFFENERVAP